MPTPTAYEYLITDTANDKVSATGLAQDIGASSITIQLDHSVIGGAVFVSSADGTVSIAFKDDLGSQKTVLDSVVAAHDGVPPETPQLVSLNHALKEDGRQIVETKGFSEGFYLGDRDIKVVTCTVDESAAVLDRRMDTLTNKRVAWGEATLHGVFKDSGGNMVQCSDQPDADTNGILTIVDYDANDQKATPSPAKVQIRGGTLWVDDQLPAANQWESEVYVVIGPGDGLPNIPMFDAFLWPYSGNWLQARDDIAMDLDPTPTSAVSKVRAYFWHPVGQKDTHVLRFHLYRPLSTI